MINTFDNLGTPVDLSKPIIINNRPKKFLHKNWRYTRYGKIRVVSFGTRYWNVILAKQLLKATRHLIGIPPAMSYNETKKIFL